ncbi:MAG: DUF1573 domain-containing protein, partial [Pirellula sp.]|nr:DUF1573 domain-containing protein [Pirellula sp.]
MTCLLSPISSIAQDGDDLKKSDPFVVKLENPSFSTVHATIDIGSIQRGKTATIPLRFENLLDSEIKFNDVVVQCACTGARIPDETIKITQSIDGEVDLSISKGERMLTKVFSLEIKASGKVDRVLLDLKANISDVVAFNQELYSVAYDSERLASGKGITLSLPVIASADVDLSGVVVLTSGALNSKASKHITAEYKPVVDEPPVKNAVGVVAIRIDPQALSSESEYLTVNITGKHFEAQTAQIVLRKKLPISLIPEILFFSSTDLENVQAFGFIRVGSDLDASTMKLISVKLESGEVLDASLLKSSSKVARLELTCSKEKASNWTGGAKNLEITVECNG